MLCFRSAALPLCWLCDCDCGIRQVIGFASVLRIRRRLLLPLLLACWAPRSRGGCSGFPVSCPPAHQLLQDELQRHAVQVHLTCRQPG